MMLVRKSLERGYFENEWLKSYHTFSFSSYYDARFMGFSSLRVINQDYVAAGAGFPTHGHRDMEIITYMLKGKLEHKDSMGHVRTMNPGDFQVMSAGRGVQHSEYNPDASQDCELLQIWIMPNAQGHEPRYDQVSLTTGEGLNLVVSGDQSTPLFIHQKAKISVGKFKSGEQIEWELQEDRSYWLQLIEGEIKLEGQTIGAGDAVGLSQAKKLSLEIQNQAHFLWFELP